MRKILVATSMAFLVAACGTADTSTPDSPVPKDSITNDHIANVEGYEVHRITLDGGQKCIAFVTDGDWNLGLSCDWNATTTTSYFP